MTRLPHAYLKLRDLTWRAQSLATDRVETWAVSVFSRRPDATASRSFIRLEESVLLRSNGIGFVHEIRLMLAAALVFLLAACGSEMETAGVVLELSLIHI